MLTCLLCLLASVASGLTAIGQTPAEITTRDVPVTFKTRVNLVPVPVVVRDSRGHAVGNLERDDFRLFQDGDPQVISRFTVERSEAARAAPANSRAPGAAPPETLQPVMPDRFVAYVFDDLHMNPEHLVWVRDAIIRRLAQSEDAFERTAVYTTSGRNSLDFTNDIGRLRRTLLELMPGGARHSPVADCPPVTEFMADLILNKRDKQALAVAIGDYFECAGPSPGRADIMVEATAQRVLAERDVDAGRSLEAIDSVVGKLATMPGQRSLVLVSPGFLLIESNRRQQEVQAVERAIRASVILHSVDARGLETRIIGGDASQRTLNVQTALPKAMYERQAALQVSGVMADLASGTGGTFFENSNDVDRALERTSHPEYLYVLGFVPATLKLDGRFHSLKVTLRNSRGLTLQARRGYYAPQYAEDPAEQVKQQIEEAFFSRQEIRDFAVGLQTQFLKTGDHEATVTALTRLDLKQIPFRKDADRNCDEVTIVAGVFDRHGNYVSGLQKVLEMRLRDETLQRRLTTGYTIRTDFNVPPGTYLIRMIVREAEGGLLSAQSSVIEIP